MQEPKKHKVPAEVLEHLLSGNGFHEDPEFIKQITDHSATVIYVFDLDSKKFSYLSTGASDLLGFDSKYLITRGRDMFGNLIHPDDDDKRFQYIEGIYSLTSDNSVQTELRLRTKNNGYRWFRLRDRVFKRDKNGVPLQSVGTAFDINDEKLASQDAMEAHKWLSELMDNIPNAVIAFESVRNKSGNIRDLKYLFTNNRALQLINRRDLTGKLLAREFPNSRKNGLFQKLVQVIETGKPLSEEFYYNEDNLKFWTILNVSRINDGCLVSFIDISIRKKALQNQERAEKILDNIQEACYHLDRDGKIEFVNKKGLDLIGATREQVIDRNIWDVFPESAISECFDTIQNNALNRQKYSECEYVSAALQGLVLLSATPISGGCIVVLREMKDIQQAREKLEYEHRKLKEAQALGHLGNFERNLPEEKILWSDEMYCIHGLAPQSEEITFETVLMFIHPEDRRYVTEAMEYCHATGKPLNIIHRIILRDGQIKHVQRKAEIIRDEKAQVVKILGTVQDITEHELTRRLVFEQEEKYRSLAENTPDIISRWNGDLKLIYVNRAFEVSTGVSADMVYGLDTIEMGYPEEIAHPWMEKLKLVFNTGQSLTHYNSYVRPDGIVYFHSRIVPEKNAEGEVETVLTIGRDITDLKNAEQELLKNKILLEAVFDSTSNSIAVQKPVYEDGAITDYDIILVNRAFVKLLDGRDPVGSRASEFLPEGIRPGLFEKFNTVMKTGIATDFEQQFSGLNQPGCYRIGAKKVMDLLIVTSEDITARKQYEDKIHKQANFIQQITEVIPDIIIVTELPSREVIYTNHSTPENEPDALLKLNSVERDQVVHQDDLLKMKSYYSSLEDADDEEIITAEYRALSNRGEWIWLRVRGKVFERNSSGRPVSAVHISQNITLQKTSAIEIQELNKTLVKRNRELAFLNSELNTFNTVTANDYGETLRHIYLNLEVIISSDAKNLSHSGRANLRRAQAGIQKLNLLTDDLKSYGRLQEIGAKEEHVDMEEILRNVLQSFENQLQEFGTGVERKPLPVVQGYPSLISLLFHHLIDNAIKFQKDGAEHKIRINCWEFVDGKLLEIEQASPLLQYHVITVSDNGIGFPAEEAQKIFDIFYRLHPRNKYRGSGIGLSICRKIMEMHGGFIIAESVREEGASFHCYFPV
jgi:PAS domain S-box-containing protein